jgi:RNA polymerase sigma-70 factor (ECF subfamily)
MAAEEVTQLLMAWRGGDDNAFDKLLPLVYEELKSLAHRYMNKEGAGQTLQTTALVHEAYLRLVRGGPIEWESRAHFFAVCATVMRHLMVDRARARQAAKRDAGGVKVALEDAEAAASEAPVDLLALGEALDRLQAIDERKARIVEMRYFAGLSVDETAEVLGLSSITIKREWLKAKAFLYAEMYPS